MTRTALILGCGNFGGIGSAPAFFGQGESEEEAFAVMDAAWAAGIHWFDTADAYGGGRSETAIGKWIRATGNRPRLTTKTYNPMDTGQDHGLNKDFHAPAISACGYRVQPSQAAKIVPSRHIAVLFRDKLNS